VALLDVPSGMAAARADKQMDRSSRPKNGRGPWASFRIRCSTRAEDPRRPRVWFCAGRSVAPRSKLRVRLSVFREAVHFVADPVEGSLSPMITAGVPRLGLRQDEALRLGLRGEKEEVCRLVRVDQAGLVEETGKEGRRARPGVVDLSLEPLPPGPGAGAWREAPTRSSLRRRGEGKGFLPGQTSRAGEERSFRGDPGLVAGISGRFPLEREETHPEQEGADLPPWRRSSSLIGVDGAVTAVRRLQEAAETSSAVFLGGGRARGRWCRYSAGTCGRCGRAGCGGALPSPVRRAPARKGSGCAGRRDP